MRRALIGSAALLLLVLASAAAGRGKADAVRWRALAAGEKESKKTGKPVLYFFTANWCGPCHVLVDQVFADETAAAAIEKRYVPVVLEDREREEGGNAAGLENLARRFDVQGFPTLVVARPGTGKAVRLAGWVGRKKTLEFIDGAAARLLEMEKESAVKR
ncbi:MAG TPA: thioredoxin family protein [Thermoanaerobaculia bacterium]|nr:thioredoxin family protein [Thermoanaerobaculia bacterium]